jgi:hypothetical protein
VREYPAQHRERPNRRLLLAVAGGAFVTGCLFAVVAPLGRGAGRGTTTTQPIANTSVDRTAAGSNELAPASVNGAPAGFAHTESGAVAAAASYVCTGQALIDMDPLAAEDAIREMSATATADSQVREQLDKLTGARQALAKGVGPIVFRQSPISWRVDGYAPDRAQVGIWSVSVLSRDGVAPPQASWSTSTFDLVWERDGWRIFRETIVPGPAPLLDNSSAPATSAQLASVLDGFTDFGSIR